MDKFFRKFILHKYSGQITEIGKRPAFIISDDEIVATNLASELNKHPKMSFAENRAPFLNHMGSLAYAQFVGPEAEYFIANSKFKGDKLEESLRKISFKNTLGNNYGFELNPIRKSEAKKLKGNLDTFRWGAIIEPDIESYKGLNYLFKQMKVLYIFQDRNNAKYKYLFSQDNCLCIEKEQVRKNKDEVLQKIYGFLGVEFPFA